MKAIRSAPALIALACCVLPLSASASSISRESIDSIVHARMNDFTACYEEGLARNPRLAGKITVRFKIEGEEGAVTEAVVAKTTVRDDDVEACVIGLVNELRFPGVPHDEPVTITYPLTFEPADEPAPAPKKKRTK